VLVRDKKMAKKQEFKKHLWDLYSLSDGEIGEKPPKEEMEKWE